MESDMNKVDRILVPILWAITIGVIVLALTYN
ncbi:MAG: hypothetical protein JWN75_1180 [Candidatus Saccharibacteria bacterium]|nr:hypothetical protein [Candidatus Saccharibacteria bacterium]